MTGLNIGRISLSPERPFGLILFWLEVVSGFQISVYVWFMFIIGYCFFKWCWATGRIAFDVDSYEA